MGTNENDTMEYFVHSCTAASKQQHLKGTCNRTKNKEHRLYCNKGDALVILCTNIFDKRRNNQFQSKFYFYLQEQTKKM